MSHLGSVDDSAEAENRTDFRKKGSSYAYVYKEAIRRMETKIVKITAAYGSTGISHTQLANFAGIDRKNLTAYTKRLIRKGLLRKGPGKQGRYYLANQHNKGPIITPDVFGATIADEILGKEDFELNSPFFTNTETRHLPERAFFLFSNKLGASMTYLLIQSLSESNKILAEPKDSNSLESKVNAWRWINDAISSIIPSLLTAFREAVISIALDSKIPTDELMDIFERPYALRESFISKLLDLFCSSYPGIWVKLEHIRSRLPGEVDREIARWEYMAERAKQQKICEHEFGRPTNETLVALIKNNRVDRGDNSINVDSEILHCCRCHLTKSENSKI